MRARPYQVGFMGTRRKLTDLQVQALIRILSNLGDARLHHGDCVGADAKAHEIATELLIPVVIHPPDNPTYRARCSLDHRIGGVIHPVKSYRERDMDIVLASDGLIACPGQDREVRRSGTWMTVRMGRLASKPLTLIFPDGTERHERGGVNA